MKDLFSQGSELYRKARPSYPVEVIQDILKYVPHKKFAWDCGAGSGQFTQLLAPYFEHIVATDLSERQLHQAPYFENVSYQVQSAEQTSFNDRCFDLITVAQALHWFDFKAFYREVNRTLKQDGVLAVIGYGTPKIQHETIQSQLESLYQDILKGYWDEERRHIDTQYETVPFPFELLFNQKYTMQVEWSREQVLAYLNTWSAVRHYREKNANTDCADPLQAFSDAIHQYDQAWIVEFPIFLKIGRPQARLQRVKLRPKVKIQQIFKRDFLKIA